MFSSHTPNSNSRTHLKLVSQAPNLIDATQVRIRLQIPLHYRHAPIISQLISDYGLVVNITGALLVENIQTAGRFDLELQGNYHQLCQAFAFLESLDIEIIGKPTVAGDNWHC